MTRGRGRKTEVGKVSLLVPRCYLKFESVNIFSVLLPVREDDNNVFYYVAALCDNIFSNMLDIGMVP